MSASPPSPHALRVSELTSKPHPFALRPEATSLKLWASELGLDALRKLSFTGELRPSGKRDWTLKATLGATVEQPCTVTLSTVRTRIETKVQRTFAADYAEPDTPESEMPEDENMEPLGAWIDLEAVMIESLSLEIPHYPRAHGVSFDGTQVAADGVAPLTDEAVKPFAGLAALRDKLKDTDS